MVGRVAGADGSVSAVSTFTLSPGCSAYAAQAIASEVPDRIVRADLLATLSIFGRLVYPEINVLELIGREQMRESKFLEELAVEERMATRREDIRELVQVRFGTKAAGEVVLLLAQISDPERLAQLHRLAIKCRLGEFRKALSAQAVN
jgi:hypothetical protein